MWVLVMTHIASWPVPAGTPHEEADVLRWNTAQIRSGRYSASAKRKGKGQGPSVTTISDYTEKVCVYCLLSVFCFPP
jgi:hypothetical protein